MADQTMFFFRDLYQAGVLSSCILRVAAFEASSGCKSKFWLFFRLRVISAF